jgi:hypothetical protein
MSMPREHREHARCTNPEPHGSHFWTGAVPCYCPGVPNPDGSPLTLSAGFVQEPCMREAAIDWMPLVLELRHAMACSNPSAVTLARAFTDAYPKLDTYGVFLACQWAATATPIGA